jgi:hypothetical protein
MVPLFTRLTMSSEFAAAFRAVARSWLTETERARLSNPDAEVIICA